MSAEPLSGLVVVLDEAPLTHTIAVMEVLIQEGLTTVSLPSTHGDVADVAGLYRSRVRLGLHGPVEEPERMAELGLSFALVDYPDQAVATPALACYVGAMTPTEIRAVLASPVTGVQLFPADVLGPLMAERLKSLGVVDRVVPRGGIIAYTAKQWLKLGAPAVCVDSQLLGDALTGGDLAALRDRCRNFQS